MGTKLNKIYGRFVQNKAGSGAVGRLPSRLSLLGRTSAGDRGPGREPRRPPPSRARLPQRGPGPRPGSASDRRRGQGPRAGRSRRTRTAKGRRGGAPRRGQGTRRRGGRTSRRQAGTRPTRPRGGGAGDPEREARRAEGARRPRRPGRPARADRARSNSAPLPLVGGEVRTGRGPPRATTRRAARSAGAGRQTSGRAVGRGHRQARPGGARGPGTRNGAGAPERTRGPAPRRPTGEAPLLDIGSLLRQGPSHGALPQCQDQTISRWVR